MKTKLLLLSISLIVLVAAVPAYQSATRFRSLIVQDFVTVGGAMTVTGATTLGGATTLNGVTTLNGPVAIGTVTAPVVGYATTGKRLFCATNTITDTASYTVSTSAIATPQFTWCSMGAITGDAEKCAASQATGSVTVIVRNAASTPVANSTGAAVTWCVVGVP
jgi:hypothetical protein